MTPFFISCLLYVTSFILHFWERRLEAVWPSYELHLSNLGLESFKVEHKTWKAKISIWKSETEQVKGSIKNKTSAWKKWTYDRHTKAIYSTEKVKVKIWKATQTDIFCEIAATQMCCLMKIVDLTLWRRDQRSRKATFFGTNYFMAEDQFWTQRQNELEQWGSIFQFNTPAAAVKMLLNANIFN